MYDIISDDLFDYNYNSNTEDSVNYSFPVLDFDSSSNNSNIPVQCKGKRKRYTHITNDINNSPIIDPKLLISPELPKKERNKISATAYRKRRKVFLDGLEEELNRTKALLHSSMEENNSLKGEIIFLQNLLNSHQILPLPE